MNAIIKNNARVKWCEMRFNVSAHCPIGDAMYDAEITAEYVPNKRLVDFETITSEVGKLNNASFIIEELAAKVRDIIKELSAPKKIRVIIIAKTANHCPVRVVV